MFTSEVWTTESQRGQSGEWSLFILTLRSSEVTSPKTLGAEEEHVAEPILCKPGQTTVCSSTHQSSATPLFDGAPVLVPFCFQIPQEFLTLGEVI